MTSYVLLGVSGCGKTSVGVALAQKCGLQFIDGDDLHTAANIQKMSDGQPLNDADRAPWLAEVGRALAKADGTTIVGCSALKRSYRDRIRSHAGIPVHFLHLAAPKHLLQDRVNSRRGHFMPGALLNSQFEALEPLEAGESGCIIDITTSFADVVAQSETYLRETML